jgi:hypothetical protein
MEKKATNKKETKELKMPSVKFKSLEGKKLDELMYLNQAANFLAEYYENYAKANQGNYNFDAEDLYENARKTSLIYRKCEEYTISAIEKKLNSELFES